MYVEASSPRAPNDLFILQWTSAHATQSQATCSANLGCASLSGDCCPTPNGITLSCCSPPTVPPASLCPAGAVVQSIEFYYHMYGSGINRLEVRVTPSSAAGQGIQWTKSGAQVNSWQFASVQMPPLVTDVYFAAYRGNTYAGDIAIDDVVTTCGVAQPAPPSPPPSQPRPVTPPPAPPSLTFSFDTGTDGWVSASGYNKFEWIRRSAGTPSAGTGPSTDHSGTGYYMFIETSHPRVQGQEFDLTVASPIRTAPFGTCPALAAARAAPLVPLVLSPLESPDSSPHVDAPPTLC